MSCGISIDLVEGVLDTAGNLTAVRVQGSREECDRIELRVSCLDATVGGLLESAFIVTPTERGTWSAELPIARLHGCVRCGSPVTVLASCLIGGGDKPLYDPDCEPASQTLSLPCPGGRCPVVRATTFVSPDCGTDLTRAVIFDITIDAPAGTVVRTSLIAGDGTEYASRIDRTYRIGHRYDATDPTTAWPRIRILEPTGCPDIVLPRVEVPVCHAPPPPTRVCPAFRDITATRFGGCDVIWTANIVPPTAGSFVWRFDGWPPEPPNHSPVARMTYPTSGHHRVEVFYTPDIVGCPTARTTGDVVTEGCESAGGDVSERTECVFGRLALVVLLGMAFAFAAIATCRPPAPFVALAIASLVAFAVAALLWAFFCPLKPCHWFLLVTGEALFAAGLILVNVIGCCPTAGFIGAGLAVAGVLTVFGWAATCDFDECVVFQELGFVTVGVLPSIIVLLATTCGVPGFAEHPVAATVWGILSLAGAVFTAAAMVCLGNNGLSSRLNSQDRHRVNPIGGRPVFPDE